MRAAPESVARWALWWVAVGIATAAQAAPLTVTVHDGEGHPLADAVVAVLVRGVHSSAGPDATAQLGQKSRQFVPQLLVVQSGTPVSFPNFDTVRHHVYSFSPIHKFELKLYAGTPAAPVVFDKAGVATLGCNIHDRMSAYLIVVDTPLFVRTGASGTAVFDVPAGDHVLQSWHARLPDPLVVAEQTQTTGAGATLVTLRLPVTAAAAP